MEEAARGTLLDSNSGGFSYMEIGSECLGLYGESKIWRHKFSECVQANIRIRGAGIALKSDFSFMNNNLEIESIVYSIPLGKNDHSVLEFEYVVNKEITEESKRDPNAKRRYKGGKSMELNKLFRDIIWEAKFHCQSVE